MSVVRNIERLDSKLNKPVLVIGNFDGVHLGHRHVLSLVKKRAIETGGTSVVLTFNPHPRTFFNPQTHEPMITTLDQRIQLLEELEIDTIIVQTFDEEFASISARDFVAKILVDKLGVEELFVSNKFRFGYKAEGNVRHLEQMSEEFGFRLEVVENIHFRHTLVASTFIRWSLMKGETEIAMKMLGRPYSLTGTVYADTRRGTSVLNFPTCNINTINELIPANGIYASSVRFEGRRYPAATYIGTRPTFEGQRNVIESHIIGFNDDLYGKEISIDLYRKIRDDRKFRRAIDLKLQIERDIENIKAYLKRHLKDPEFPEIVWPDGD